MDSFQVNSFRFLLPLVAVLILGTPITTDGSVRAESVSDFRHIFNTSPERDVNKEIEEGILLPPPLPADNEAWSKSLNLVQPLIKPQLTVEQLFFRPIVYEAIVRDFKITTEKNKDIPQMSYVDSSLFRRSNSKDEGVPAETSSMTKKYTGKYFGSDSSKSIVNEKTKPTEKHSEFNKKKSDSEHKSSVTEPIDQKYIQQITAEPPTTTKTTSEATRPIEIPPVWSHASLSEEISDPFGRLPSNEEYDRNTRFAHSILFGYNTGF